MPVTTDDVLEEDSELAPEGRLLVRVHRVYERNSENRRKKLAAFQRLNAGRIFCECCGFDFESTYGERGVNFIESHHQFPVSRLTPTMTPKLSDLRLVCSNCHRMIHVRQPWLAVEELRALLSRLSRHPTPIPHSAITGTLPI